MEKKKLFDFKTRTIVATGLGAALFTVMFMYLKVPTGIPETEIQTETEKGYRKETEKKKETEKQTEPGPGRSPRTGDDAPVAQTAAMMMAGLGMLAAAAFAGSRRRKHRRQ